ncbi:MAG: hypothetical protein Q7J06_05095 [Bacteroidales bacterium]|nr:hypothetical protein [Bacteroidales bacterium]
MDRVGIRKAGNAGLVTTTVAANGILLHSLPIGRTCRITKIVAYNNTGANLPLLFGTRDRAVDPALVQLLPDLVAINTLDNEWTEEEIPAVEFIPDTQLLAAGRTGDIYVVAGTVAVPVAGAIISIEVEEFGA